MHWITELNTIGSALVSGVFFVVLIGALFLDVT